MWPELIHVKLFIDLIPFSVTIHICAGKLICLIRDSDSAPLQMLYDIIYKHCIAVLPS